MRILSRWIVACILTQWIPWVISYEIEDYNGSTEEVTVEPRPIYFRVAEPLHSGIKNITTIYRLPNEYSSVVLKEFHRWGTATNMLLKTSDGRYLDSAEGILPLGCTLATEDCKWILSPEWGYTNWSVSEDDHFSINVDDLGLKEEGNCEQRNGGCEVFCQMVDGKTSCSCPVGYTNYGSCRYENHEVTIISISSERKYSSGRDKKWLIIPPQNSTIHAEVSVDGNYGHRTYYGGHHSTIVENAVNLREIFEDNTSYYKMFSTILTNYRAKVESNSILEITSTSISSSIKVDFMRKLLTLEGDRGWLKYEIIPQDGYICVSIIYYTSSASKEIIQLTAQFSNGTISEEIKFTERQFNKWNMRSFKLSLEENFNEAVQLKLSVSGKGITIHSIYGCSNEDVLITRFPAFINEIPNREETQRFETDPTEHCQNGGKFNSPLKKCTCPEGYVGDACEQACGPNNFGQNCSKECSLYGWGCREMIFCKDGFPCLCAPGFEGTKCDQMCRGSYGPNCFQKCGRCLHGSACDPYTGECDSPCESGYRSPLCQIPYRYPKYPPTVIDRQMNAVTMLFHTNELLGQGNIQFYQLQYRETQDTSSEDWTELQPCRVDGQFITTNISDLSAGTEYDVRVIYIDEDGGSYDRELVPQAQFSTLCTVPTSTDYNMNNFVTSTSIELSWKFASNINDCPVTGFTVILRRKGNTLERNVTTQLHSNGEEHTHTFSDLLPGTSYKVKIWANTRFGPAPSATFSVKTEDYVPGRVSNLQVKRNGHGKLLVSWRRPMFSERVINKYIVEYKCLSIMGCQECYNSLKEVTVLGNKHFVELSDLMHHTHYLIGVAAMARESGPLSWVFGLTQDKAPDAAPEAMENSLYSSTNSSVTIEWLPLKDCTLLNGYLVGYHYELLAPNNTILTKGETVLTNVTFHNLIPRTSYTVHVFAVSSGGFNVDQKLVINATTAATVPDKVQDLTIYKRGRRVLGLRWSKPINTYGEIESFDVSFCQTNSCVAPVAITVAPEPCIPWPSYFCHTINGVLPNTRYYVSVRARNVIVKQYGNAATIYTTTVEGAPESPISLRVSSRSSNSLVLEWKPPVTFNGILRSFLINVEHLDSSNATNCCSYFPLQEIAIKKEEEKYIYEVTGLSPASKYTIGVSAKTISLGPATFLEVNTPPEIPELNHNPQLIDDNTVRLTSEGRFPGLVGTYLLLIFPENGNSRPTFWDPELSKKFESIIKRNFYIAEEINAEEIIGSVDIEIGKGISEHNGTIATLEDPEVTTDFDVGVALVLEYNGAANVGVMQVVD